MKWYMPSWNGDLRLEPTSDSHSTLLWIEKPTDREVVVLQALQKTLEKAGIKADFPSSAAGLRRLFRRKRKVQIMAPLEKVGPMLTAIFKPGPAVLTAVKFKDGRLETCQGSGAELAALADSVAASDKAADAEKKPEKKAEAAATVKRPTPSCPQCTAGSIEPAKEVLIAFLNEEEHAQWASRRQLIVTGGLSGHRYLLAHRHTEAARSIGRICFDLDTECVVHFHDRSVPPEEEVLAAKLILEHAEPWLRNEATMLGAWGKTIVFKNPFGGGMDGGPDAYLTARVGDAVLRALS